MDIAQFLKEWWSVIVGLSVALGWLTRVESKQAIHDRADEKDPPVRKSAFDAYKTAERELLFAKMDNLQASVNSLKVDLGNYRQELIKIVRE